MNSDNPCAMFLTLLAMLLVSMISLAPMGLGLWWLLPRFQGYLQVAAGVGFGLVYVAADISFLVWASDRMGL